MAEPGESLRVTLLATPDTQVSPLSGLYETLNSFGLLAAFERDIPARPFEVEIVGPTREDALGASGLPLGVQRAYHEVEQSDIVIIPLMMMTDGEWQDGRYPGVTDWLRDRHDQGAMLCSACTGVLLLAETGLLDGREATVHWAFAPVFRRCFPKVRLRPEEVLVVAGDSNEFVMAGGVMSWHDLALYLIARYVGPTAAHAMARMLMLEWHGEGQSPYVSFSPRLDHDDALVRELQQWLQEHFTTPNTIEELMVRSPLSQRSLERRFRRAVKCSPLQYVQDLRIAEARRRLERSNTPVEQIAFEVGYENAAFFRRVFKRSTRMTPGAYRRKFRFHSRGSLEPAGPLRG